jgi:predicted HD phosphohydrolase
MTYTRMDRSVASDWQEDQSTAPALFANIPDHVLGQLDLLKGDCGAAGVDRYVHSLQTATRCLRDNEDHETVVCALLHDIGDSLAPSNHAELAASVLRPFVSEQNWWVVKHHDLFQGYYYFHFVGMDRNLRDRYRDHRYFRACVKFCARWDQRSFDPDYDTEPIETFVPLVREVLTRQPRDLFAEAPAE